MSTARQWRQYDRDRADADLIRRTAAWLRDDPERARHAGLDIHSARGPRRDLPIPHREQRRQLLT